MKTGDSVYVIESPHEPVGGIPALLCAINGTTARVSIESEAGTTLRDVPLWDILPVRLFTASVLRAAYGAYERLERERGSLVGISQTDLVAALRQELLDDATAKQCTDLSSEVDWASPCPLFAWMKAIRNFYYPRFRA